MCADEIRESLMGQRQGHDDSVGSDPSPAFGQMPERQQQTILNPLVVGNCQRYSERVRPPGPPGEQLNAELWPGSHPGHKAVIEHR